MGGSSKSFNCDSEGASNLKRLKNILGLLYFESLRDDWHITHIFPMALWTMYCLNVQNPSINLKSLDPRSFVIGTHSTHTPMLAYINSTSDRVQIM